jgi:hypothetical protein
MPQDDQDTGRAVPTPAAVAGRPARPGPEGATGAPERAGSPGDRDGSTGDAGVDEALGRLAELDDLPVRAHVAVFDAVHVALQDRLADVED